MLTCQRHTRLDFALEEALDRLDRFCRRRLFGWFHPRRGRPLL